MEDSILWQRIPDDDTLWLEFNGAKTAAWGLVQEGEMVPAGRPTTFRKPRPREYDSTKIDEIKRGEVNLSELPLGPLEYDNIVRVPMLQYNYESGRFKLAPVTWSLLVQSGDALVPAHQVDPAYPGEDRTVVGNKAWREQAELSRRPGVKGTSDE